MSLAPELVAPDAEGLRAAVRGAQRRRPGGRRDALVERRRIRLAEAEQHARLVELRAREVWRELADVLAVGVALGAGEHGDALPERELARKMGVSRPSLRSGLRTLQAMGIVTSRRGAGTFIVEGPPQLGKAPLQFLVALHGFTLDQMYEARRMLEVGAAGLAAERATEIGRAHV